MDRSALARPGQLLTDHLDGVTENVRALVPDTAETPDQESLQEVVATVAQLHDFGKLTSHFQSYLREAENRGPTPEEYHAPVSAIVTLQALKARGYTKDTALAGYYAVAKHHSVLPNMADDLKTKPKSFEKAGGGYHVVADLIADINQRNKHTAESVMSKATDEALAWERIVETDERRYLKTFQIWADKWTPTPQFYQTVLRIWSTLTCADKLDAGDIPISQETIRPDPSKIQFENTAEGIVGELNEKRTKARQEAVEKSQSLRAAGEQVFTITLPTGFGKTAAGLQTALTLAEQEDSRVVYALPFTTVIDQIHNEVLDIFDVTADSEAYTIHHHLADTRTRVEEERLADGSETLYGETWQAGLVLTTFVQLFESVAGPGNIQSIKLPALQDAIIVVDEPQALPRRWWFLVSRLITMLVDEYEATVLLMTATQPRIIEEINPAFTPQELVAKTDSDSNSGYFGFLDTHERVEFTIHESLQHSIQTDGAKELLDHTQTGAEILDRIDADAQNVLTISNTVPSATEVAESINHELESRENGVTSLGQSLHEFYTAPEHARQIHEALHRDTLEDVVTDFFAETADCHTHQPDAVTASLTAALRPCDRSLLISAMRAILNPEISTPFDDIPLIVSSTQLVEAGVDVSFDRIYRDFAPVPSLVQAAGRCNRSFEGSKGEVVLWQLAPTEGSERLPSVQIYARQGDRLTPSRLALRDVADNTDHVSEFEMITTANEAYYQYLHERDHTTEQTDALAQAVDKAHGERLRNASLIEDRTEEAVVLLTDADADHLQTYLEERLNRDFQAADHSFSHLKHLMVSVTPERLERLKDTDEIVCNLVGQAVENLEFDVVDARETTAVYSLPSGQGLRD